MQHKKAKGKISAANLVIGGLVIAGVIACGLWLYLRSRPNPSQENAPVALVSIASKPVMKINLASYKKDTVIDLSDKFSIPIKLEIKDHMVRFIEVACPDHICEQMGFVKSEGESIVCMPNRTILTLLSRDEAATIAVA